MTPEVGTLSGTTWKETKIIVIKGLNPSSSPYIDPTATNPFFEFTDMSYYVDPSNTGSVNIRISCPITYILKESSAGAPINYSLTTLSGTSGYDGVYRLTLDTSVIETTGTYEVIVEGVA